MTKTFTNMKCFIAAMAFAMLLLNQTIAKAQVVPVIMAKNADSTWQLWRGGQPYFVKGVCGDFKIKELTQIGGNSMRTYGYGNGTAAFLDSCAKYNVTVCVGFWLNQAHNWWTTNNVNNEVNNIINQVNQIKNKSSVLCYAIGNELDLNGSNDNVWRGVNTIAQAVRAADGDNHPVITVLSNGSTVNIGKILTLAPSLNMLGINSYAGIDGAKNNIAAAGWNKPYMITEWGPSGHWETAKTVWGTPIEQNSKDKATLIETRYNNNVVNPNNQTVTRRCVGSYVFLWGYKQERTPTWYSMYSRNSTNSYQPASTPYATLDAVQKNFTGQYPANRAPFLNNFTLDGKSPTNPNIQLTVGQSVQLVTSYTDESQAACTYQYRLFRDPIGGGTGGSAEAELVEEPATFIYGTNGNATLIVPNTNPAYKYYRVFVFVRDPSGKTAYHNIPVQINPQVLVIGDNSTYALHDAYVDKAQPATTLGVADMPRLVVGNVGKTNEKDAYFIFPVTTNRAGMYATGGALKLFSKKAITNHRVQIKAVDYIGWDERLITWDNKEPLSTIICDTVLSIADSGYVNLTIDPAYFKSHLAVQSAARLTFAVVSAGTGQEPEMVFNSKETGSKVPELVINFTNICGAPLLDVQSAPKVAAGKFAQLYITATAPCKTIASVSVNGEVIDTWAEGANNGSEVTPVATVLVPANAPCGMMEFTVTAQDWQNPAQVTTKVHTIEVTNCKNGGSSGNGSSVTIRTNNTKETVILNGVSGTIGKLYVYDVAGRRVKYMTNVSTSGGTLTLSTADMPTGSYAVRIEGGSSGNATLRFNKQ